MSESESVAEIRALEALRAGCTPDASDPEVKSRALTLDTILKGVANLQICSTEEKTTPDTADANEFVTDALNVPEWNPCVLQKELPELANDWIPGMVVAGGALVSWAFPDKAPIYSQTAKILDAGIAAIAKSAKGAAPDIDLWVFTRDVFLATVARFQASQNNVVTCIRRCVKIDRPKPAKPVQVIYWPNRTPSDLVSEFDIDAVRAYTDGRCRYLHPSCVRSWQSRTVFSVRNNTIPLYRLLKMTLKGFSISLPPSVTVDPSLQPHWGTTLETRPFDVQVRLLADAIDSISANPDNASLWVGYHGRPAGKCLPVPRDFCFETVVKFKTSKEDAYALKRKKKAPPEVYWMIGVTHVPDYIENALIKQTSLLFFLRVADGVPDHPEGPARLTVRVYGVCERGGPVIRVIGWERGR